MQFRFCLKPGCEFCQEDGHKNEINTRLLEGYNLAEYNNIITEEEFVYDSMQNTGLLDSLRQHGLVG